MSNDKSGGAAFDFWWSCIEAGNECDGETPIPDEAVILHYCANGTTAMVTAGNIRSMIDERNKP